MIRYLAWALFRKASVVLIDHDGELSFRFVRGYPGFRFAKRYGFGAIVRLLPDGTAQGPCYVKTWFPLVGDPRVEASSGKAAA